MHKKGLLCRLIIYKEPLQWVFIAMKKHPTTIYSKYYAAVIRPAKKGKKSNAIEVILKLLLFSVILSFVC
jgi:hypothetical protein